MTITLRACAVAIALAALIDPAWRMQQELPLPVRLHLDERDLDAIAVRERLRQSLGPHVEFRDYGKPAAVVAIGDVANSAPASLSAPVSTVSLAGDRDVSVVDAPSSVSMVVGSVVNVDVELSGRGVRGITSTVSIEEGGVELGRVDHTWTDDGYGSVTLSYLAARGGVHRVTVRVHQLPGETRILDNTADVGIFAADRPVRVAVYEARPSWPAGFVRRALEDDPAFQVSSVLRISRGVFARSGSAPRILRRRQFDEFDVVLIGAPEELQKAEIQALREFAEIRGGTVIFLPDRSVSGAYQALLPRAPSEELLRQPQKLAPAGLMVSEIVTVEEEPPAASVFVRFAEKAVVLSWPAGDGRIVFSGALDAWRYRANPNSAFTRFWRGVVLSAALAAPPRLVASVSPAIVGPNERARLTVRLRRTEFDDPKRAARDGRPIVLPAVEASLVDPTGRAEMIRLWPTAEPGVFEADVSPSGVGLQNIRVAADNGAAAHAVLIVDRDASMARGAPLREIPELTGGVRADASNLDPLIRHLSAISHPSREMTVHPMRSSWWMVPFALALCGEWLVRRRRGQR